MKRGAMCIIVVLLSCFYFECSAPASGAAHLKACKASWYDAPHGAHYWVAHKTLPFGTHVAVFYKGKRITERVEDRGPFVSGRCLDMSDGTSQSSLHLEPE